MIKKTNIGAVLFIFFCALSNTALAQVEAPGALPKHQHLKLKLVGTGSLFKQKVPGIDEEALCFDIDLVDLKSDNTIGSATDCLSDIQSRNGGISVLTTTFFNLRDSRQSIRTVCIRRNHD